MAASNVTATPGVALTITAAQSPCTVLLGGAGDIGPGTWGIDAKASSWTSNNVVVKGRGRSAGLTAADDKNWPYQLVSSVNDQTAGTPITANDFIYVRAECAIISLVVTVGGADVTVTPVPAVA